MSDINAFTEHYDLTDEDIAGLRSAVLDRELQTELAPGSHLVSTIFGTCIVNDDTRHELKKGAVYIHNAMLKEFWNCWDAQEKGGLVTEDHVFEPAWLTDEDFVKELNAIGRFAVNPEFDVRYVRPIAHLLNSGFGSIRTAQDLRDHLQFQDKCTLDANLYTAINRDYITEEGMKAYKAGLKTIQTVISQVERMAISVHAGKVQATMSCILKFVIGIIPGEFGGVVPITNCGLYAGLSSLQYALSLPSYIDYFTSDVMGVHFYLMRILNGNSQLHHSAHTWLAFGRYLHNLPISKRERIEVEELEKPGVSHLSRSQKLYRAQKSSALGIVIKIATLARKKLSLRSVSCIIRDYLAGNITEAILYSSLCLPIIRKRKKECYLCGSALLFFESGKWHWIPSTMAAASVPPLRRHKGLPSTEFQARLPPGLFCCFYRDVYLDYGIKLLNQNAGVAFIEWLEDIRTPSPGETLLESILGEEDNDADVLDAIAAGFPSRVAAARETFRSNAAEWVRFANAHVANMSQETRDRLTAAASTFQKLLIPLMSRTSHTPKNQILRFNQRRTQVNLGIELVKCGLSLAVSATQSTKHRKVHFSVAAPCVQKLANLSFGLRLATPYSDMETPSVKDVESCVGYARDARFACAYIIIANKVFEANSDEVDIEE